MDEHGMCRLLSSVFQPFVNIGPGLITEVKHLLRQTKSTYDDDRSRQRGVPDELGILASAVDLLARLANDVKAVLGVEIVGTSSWPLCTDRYVTCHLGDPLASPSAASADDEQRGLIVVDHFETGDFYYCIIPVIASEEIAFRLAVFYYFDDDHPRFQEISLEWDNFLTLLRNCRHWSPSSQFSSSTTVNDRSPESIISQEYSTSLIRDHRGKKRWFGRCLVRNGKNSALELVAWSQLSSSRRGGGGGDSEPLLSNGTSVSCFAPTTPLFDFIEVTASRYRNSSSSGIKMSEVREDSHLQDSDSNSNFPAKTPLSMTLSTASSSIFTNNIHRIPKRIDETRWELFTDGYVSFTGARDVEDERCALVEIRLVTDADSSLLNDDHRTTSEFANVLMYLYAIHRRCSTTPKPSSSAEESNGRRECRLTLVVSNNKSGSGQDDSESNSHILLLRYFKEVIHLYMQRIPHGLDKVYFVDICADEIAKVFSDMDEEDIEQVAGKVSAVNTSELNERFGSSSSDLTETFGGTVVYDRKRWVAYRQDLERFMDVCRTVAKSCVSNIQMLKEVYSGSNMTAFWGLTVDELERELCQLKAHGVALREDSYSVQLTETGDEDLRAIRENYHDLHHLRSYREATDKVAALYAEVRKVMVQMYNGIDRRVITLEAYANAKRFLQKHEKLIEASGGITTAIRAYSGRPDNGRSARTTLQQLEIYYNDTIRSTLTETNEVLERISDLDMNSLSGEQKEILLSAADRLQTVSKMASDATETTRSRLRHLVSCHDFLDQAYDWALDGREMLNRLAYSTASSTKRPTDDLEALVGHLSTHPPIPPDCFASMLRLASDAGDEKLVIQFKAVQERCLNTERALLNWIKLLETAIGEGDQEQQQQANDSEPIVGESSASETGSKSPEKDVDQQQHSEPDRVRMEERPVQRCRSSSVMSSSTSILHAQPTFEIVRLETDMDSSAATSDQTDFTGIITEDLTEKVVSEISANTLRKKRVERLAGGSSSSGGRRSSVPAPPPPSADLLMAVDRAKSNLKRPFRKLMKRSNTCDEILLNNSKPTRHQSLETLPSISEESAEGAALSSKSMPLGDRHLGADDNTVFDGQDEADGGDSGTDTAPPFRAPAPPPCSVLSSLAYGRSSIPSPLPNCSPNVRMQHMVANELLLTEEAYVASLQYVIEHYLSEMHRTDLPHELLGQRLTIFGNIEKIYEFHIGQFLPELKQNCAEANDALGAQVAKCFLKHRSKFHLYALYNKNKPKSDALMGECAAVFFRTKQLLLRDKLDLSSYLLKPVQRMGKYALMLQQLIKACPTYDQEQLETLKAAEELVTFQLRHGNDLLAMDSIQRCDMNLKEQGQLLRQDEFIVFEGRTNHKCVRRVFLFEHLVLFSKPRRTRMANGFERESYEAKRCIKMCDVGMTEQVGDSELKFEIWFLRHTSGQRFVLQPTSQSVRTAWISCIRRILWNQALSNRELRKAETTSMGGNVCVDLKPSKDRIEDRALNASLLMKVTQPRITVSRIGHSATCSDLANGQSKRPHSLISVGSSTSSSNMSSVTDSSSGHHLRAVSVMETRHIRMSSESGICSDFNRSDGHSSMGGEDENVNEETMSNGSKKGNATAIECGKQRIAAGGAEAPQQNVVESSLLMARS